jgi:hypothetical protein
VPKYLKLVLACSICLALAAGAVWLLQRLFG